MDNSKIDKEKLIDAVISSSGGKIDKKTLAGAVEGKNIDPLLKNLSAEDKKSMEAALNSPQAKALLKAFLKGGGKNG